MECYICESNTKVVNSRSQSRLNQVWRRRVCTNCEYIFTTIERINLEASMMVKLTNNSVVPFIREKLIISINNSLAHREEHILEAVSLTNTILSKLQAKYKTPLVSSNEIKEEVKEVLNNFDKVALTFYDAYHKSI
jgi:transcriptional repressor NrdR